MVDGENELHVSFPDNIYRRCYFHTPVRHRTGIDYRATKSAIPWQILVYEQVNSFVLVKFHCKSRAVEYCKVKPDVRLLHGFHYQVIVAICGWNKAGDCRT